MCVCMVVDWPSDVCLSIYTGQPRDSEKRRESDTGRVGRLTQEERRKGVSQSEKGLERARSQRRDTPVREDARSKSATRQR